MPPKPKYSKDEIVEAAFLLVREKGAEALTARELADRLSTSSRPIFTAFENMTELKSAVLKKCQALFEQYMVEEKATGKYPEYKSMGMAYIKLAKQEKNVFKLLYMRDTTGETEPYDTSFSKATDELLRLFWEVNRTGQTILMVTHSVKAASHAGRVLFIKDGEVFHQIYKGNQTSEQLYQKISDTLTLLATGGEVR